MLWFGVVSGFNLSTPIIDKRANPNVIIVVGRFKVHSIFPPVMTANSINMIEQTAIIIVCIRVLLLKENYTIYSVRQIIFSHLLSSSWVSYAIDY